MFDISISYLFLEMSNMNKFIEGNLKVHLYLLTKQTLKKEFSLVLKATF